MARPKKNNVDYFPHQCVSGKTIFILEQKHGNDGYAFWFKLLEILGTKPGHFIDLNKIEELEFLQAKTRASEVSTVEILTTLSNLQAIDSELWGQKIVWCQNFVDGISDVYVNRRVEIPAKPSFYSQKPLEAVVSTVQSTQSKVDQSKGEETKENNAPNSLNGENKIVEDMIVLEMMKIWMKYNPTYQSDKETDYHACLQIAYKIAKAKGWPQHEVINGKLQTTVKSWETIVKFIRGDSFYGKLELAMIEKKWAGLVQAMEAKKRDSNGSPDPTKIKLKLNG